MRFVSANLGLCAIALLAFTGCAGQVATHDEAIEGIRTENIPGNKIPDSWTEAHSSQLVDDDWLKSFNDQTLTDLVAEALANNPGLKISAAQVERVNALLRQAGASLKPAVDLAGGYSDRNESAQAELYGGGVKISWEADVWGRIRSGVAATEELAGATRSDYEFARQYLAASTANAWFMAIESKLQHQFASHIAALHTETLTAVQTKQKVGMGTMRDVHLAKANQASAQEAVRKAKTALENSKRSLELLLGRYPSAAIETASQLSTLPPQMPTGIPSQLLERRPDLIAAEQRVAAAFYKKREADLMHLPRFNISLGVTDTNLTNVVSNLTAGLFMPLYAGGAIEAQVEVASADQKKSIALYAQKALQAFKEVETTLAGERHLQEREAYMNIVVQENLKAYELTKKQYEVGKIDILEVLQVQNKWIAAKIALLDISTQRLTNRVKLHLALGGSFE